MKVTLADAFDKITDYWSPLVAGDLNGQHVKLAKFKGSFDWHFHENEDELFLVHRGSFVMEFRDRRVEIGEGEFLVVPRGVEHRPVAEREAEVILFEPMGTLNTGNVVTEKTVTKPNRIDDVPR
ncbi:MAG: cupin domain-containing protein [Planctomycetota bacterium]